MLRFTKKKTRKDNDKIASMPNAGLELLMAEELAARNDDAASLVYGMVCMLTSAWRRYCRQVWHVGSLR